ncbi:hypothetical protein [Nocardia sp. CDC160]|uniref:hypothetical protein n=1 Tax=Nocardia sp. CDC160 TaxID=3112166 RepID=UPI002DBD2933|nr:hypothetical protein [Nocardia sp. CDC160]MEC3920208.1 hypothetical protein [Nocardia sp. CDC160]
MVSDAAAGNGHYKTVGPLAVPPGASPALQTLIGLAQTEIQTAVDLLGQGVPMLPPNVDDLIQPVTYEVLSRSQGTVEYKQTLAEIQERQTRLRLLDDQVPKMSKTVAANNGDAMAYIQNHVDQLNSDLKSVGAAKLTSAQETELLGRISDTVQGIYSQISAIAQSYTVSPGGSGNGDSVATGSNGGTGGDSSLGSILPMLAIAAASIATPLIAAIPQLLEHKDPSRKDGTTSDGTDPADPTPTDPASDPNPKNHPQAVDISTDRSDENVTGSTAPATQAEPADVLA